MTGRTEEENGREDRAQSPWPSDFIYFACGKWDFERLNGGRGMHAV